VELVEADYSVFSLARSEVPPGEKDVWSQYFTLSDGATYLRWPQLFEFLVSPDGRRIAAHPLGNATWEAFQTYLLGQVLSYALIKRGLEPIHATVVLVEAGAVALLGDCGYGKSSLAAAFIRAGAQLLTDDLLILKEDNGGFLAYPSFPRIKLLPETVNSILGSGTEGCLMNPYTRKLIIPLGDSQYCPTPQPLKAIFVLRPPHRGTQPRRVTIRRLTPSQTHLALHTNTFNFRITEPARLLRLFSLAARVAAAVPAKSLSYPRDLNRLPEVVEAISLNLKKMPPRRS
jgi:hypothetical protein